MQVSLMVFNPCILCYEQIFVRVSTNIVIRVTYLVNCMGLVEIVEEMIAMIDDVATFTVRTE